jgi:hypothetical protein
VIWYYLYMGLLVAVLVLWALAAVRPEKRHDAAEAPKKGSEAESSQR